MTDAGMGRVAKVVIVDWDRDGLRQGEDLVDEEKA